MLIRCKNCGAQNARNADHCWFCGLKTKKPFYEKWWFYIIVTFFVINGFGYLVGNSGPPPQVSQQVAKQWSDLEIIGETKAERNALGATVTGTVRNNKSRTLSYVQIIFNFYDAEGNQIGTAVDATYNLEAGGTWKFTAVATLDGSQIAGYRLSGLSGK